MFSGMEPTVSVLGVGIDLCSVPRISQSLARLGETFTSAAFTADERAYCDAKATPARHYAARYAAKESVMKAMGVGIDSIELGEVEIVRHPDGHPGVVLHGHAKTRAERAGISTWHLSMTHTDDLAQAIAIACSKPTPLLAGLGKPGLPRTQHGH